MADHELEELQPDNLVNQCGATASEEEQNQRAAENDGTPAGTAEAVGNVVIRAKAGANRPANQSETKPAWERRRPAGEFQFSASRLAGKARAPRRLFATSAVVKRGAPLTRRQMKTREPIPISFNGDIFAVRCGWDSRAPKNHGASRSRWGWWSRFQRLKASSLVSVKEIAASAIQRGRRKRPNQFAAILANIARSIM